MYKGILCFVRVLQRGGHPIGGEPGGLQGALFTVFDDPDYPTFAVSEIGASPALCAL